MGSLFWKTIVTSVVLLSLTVTPCGAADKVAASPKGVLKGAIHWGPSADWFDPSLPNFAQSGLFCLYLFHDALLKPMPEGLRTPGLAESWTISPDSRVYEFKLRKGVKFHNGDEMTAEDVVFTISRYKGGVAKQVKDRIEKVEAVHPYLVRVSFKTPFPNFLEYFITGECTIGWVVPKKYIEKVGEAEYKKNPIGCGPYKFVEYKPDGRIVGEAFENFWRKAPHIKRIEFYVVKETSTRYAMLKNGEVDMATLMIDVFYDRIKKDPNLRLISPESPTRNIVYMASQWDPKSPWSDPRVRKAASLAIDRQILADVHMPGCGPVGSVRLTGEPEGVNFPPDPYDPERARKLLAEAGYPKGFHGGTFYPWNGPYWAFCEQIVNYWKAIGITVDSVLLDRAAFLSKRRGGQMKGTTFIEVIGQPTIATRLEYLFGGGSYGNYPDLLELWEQYNKAFDPKIRKDVIGQIQRLMYDRTMIINLTTFNSPAGFGPKIKGNPFNIQRPYPLWFMAPFEDIELN
jgi:peptide/nickel transport system substrate-binding protein